MKPPRTENVAEKAPNAKALRQQCSENDAAEREARRKMNSRERGANMQQQEYSEKNAVKKRGAAACAAAPRNGTDEMQKHC
jgi:hypothetical protein